VSGFFWVFEFPAQPSGSHALGPLALGGARHFLAGIGVRTLHDQIPINIHINTEQRLQVINDCPPSGRRLGPSPQYCFLPYRQLSRSPWAGYTLIVDANGEEACSFDRRYGFRTYLNTPNSRYLALGGLG